MKRLLRQAGKIVALAIFWALGGFAIGLAFEAAGIHYPPLKFILASLNVIWGMLLFQGITRDPTAERLFFEGPEPEGEGDIRVGCLWLLPAALMVWGLVMWVIALLLRLFLE